MTASDSGRPPVPLVDDRFELLERLGGGGMGLVWRARDTALHREVALKEVRPSDPDLATSDPEAAAKLRERVLREARALARVHHPNVVTIHHIVDRTDLAHPWLVMELVTGGTFQDLIARGPLAPREAARIGRGVLAGLRAAHAVGVHHRDVKPANVLLRPDGTPVLTDFGIATLGDAPRLTTTGGLIGSPEYIAPERIRGEEGNPASDLWSLGMMLYVAVEGVHPLRRETSIATLVAVLDEPLPPAARSGPLAPVLAALLVRDAAARPGAGHLDRMLAEAETGTGAAPAGSPAPRLAAPPVDAVPAGFGPPPATYPPRPAAAPAGRRGRAVAAVSSVAAVGLAGVLLWTLVPDLHGGGDANASPTRSASSPGSRSGPTSGPASQPSSPETAAAGTLLSVAGGRSMAGVVRGVSGDTKVLRLTLYPDFATFSAPTRSDRTIYDSSVYRDGTTGAWGSGGTVDPDDALIELGSVNWDALPVLMKRAEKDCGVAHPENQYLIVESGLIDHDRYMSLYRVDSHRTCYVRATLQGKVTLVMKP
ncbi:serine/threonine-protein kinase [Streptomyces sp. MI02-7b]|nr:serine/threonine-protein kinase [Streptomyces sp. MI02-7b]MDX3073946.1 serine/threonine-protein kinase [Streptomyces sp. MI02-7b]